MTNVYSLDGLLVFSLLFVCTCAYFRKVPRLRSWLLSEKKGVWGVFYKDVTMLTSEQQDYPHGSQRGTIFTAVIGSRLHLPVSLSCIVMAFYVLFIK